MLPSTQVTLRDRTLRSTRTDEHGQYAEGIQIHDGASLSVEGFLLEQNAEVGIPAGGPSTRVVLQDTAIVDTRSNGRGDQGLGILAQDVVELEPPRSSRSTQDVPGRRLSTVRLSTVFPDSSALEVP